MMRAGLVALCLGLSAPMAAGSGRDLEFLGHFRVTYYWVAAEDDRYDGEPKNQVLYDRFGCEIARVSAGYRRALDREGTGRLADGRVVNVAERDAAGFRYVDLGPAAWGLGVAETPLSPFRSVAADPRRVARGSRLHLPAFADLALGEGERHGGHFVIDDVGSSIRGDHIDVFIGDEKELARFERCVPSFAKTPVYRFRPRPSDLLVTAP